MRNVFFDTVVGIVSRIFDLMKTRKASLKNPEGQHENCYPLPSGSLLSPVFDIWTINQFHLFHRNDVHIFTNKVLSVSKTK